MHSHRTEHNRVHAASEYSPSLNRTCGPSSPDLNPADDAICVALQERVYHSKKFDSVDQLEQAIVLGWRALPQRFD